MKLKVLIFALSAVAALLAACKRQAADSTSTSTGTVVFEGAGISLIPGHDWKQVGRDSFGGSAPPGVCLPTLAGKAGLIQVLLLPPDRSDPLTAAAGLRTGFDANPKAIQDSFKQESITVQSGAQVLYVTYSRQPEKAGGSEGRSHNYIVKNREGRIVAINYVTTARADAAAIHQMIRQTLKLQ